MTHTKGPWKVERGPEGKEIWGNGQPIAKIHGYKSVNNAYLIVAAPKLLYWLTIAIERGISLDYGCEEELALYEEITGTQYE